MKRKLNAGYFARDILPEISYLSFFVTMIIWSRVNLAAGAFSLVDYMPDNMAGIFSWLPYFSKRSDSNFARNFALNTHPKYVKEKLYFTTTILLIWFVAGNFYPP